MPNVFPNAALIDAHLPCNAKMTKLKAKAIQHGGACTKVFNQGGTPGEGLGNTQMAQLGIGKYYKPQGMGGICKAMSTFWIAYHANDEDFWSWLTNKGFIKVKSAQMIIEAHKQSKLGEGQVMWENKMLASVGIVLQGHSNAMIFEDVDVGATNYGRAVMMAERIVRGRWGYRSISMSREDGGHAVSAWIGQDVCYMDPNYGEYWFPSVQAFKNWFIEYWTLTGYAAKYTKDCRVFSYGKSISSVRGRNHWM